MISKFHNIIHDHRDINKENIIYTRVKDSENLFFSPTHRPTHMPKLSQIYYLLILGLKEYNKELKELRGVFPRGVSFMSGY